MIDDLIMSGPGPDQMVGGPGENRLIGERATAGVILMDTCTESTL